MALFDALYTAAAQFGYVSRREEAERALAEAESLVDPGWPLPARAMIEFVRGIVAQWGGDPAAGRRRFAAALEILRGSVAENDAYLESVWTLLIAADLCLRNAREVIVAADEFLSRPRLPTRAFNQAIVGSYRAVARIQVGELDRGEAELRAGLEPLSLALGSAYPALCHVAYLAARRNRPAIAARLLGAVEALRPHDAMPLAPSFRVTRDDATRLAQEALGEARYDEEQAVGRELTLESALGLGLGA